MFFQGIINELGLIYWKEVEGNGMMWNEMESDIERDNFVIF